MRQKHVDRGLIRFIDETIAMTQESRSSSRGIAAWWLLVAASLAALVGVIAGKLFFSTTKLVEKPVEVIVEKKVEVPVEVIKTVEKRIEVPVEVVKTVEKRVEVPAALTEGQKLAVAIVDQIVDAESRGLGIGPKSLFPAEGNSVKVYVSISDVAKPHISESEVRARVESVFRRDGFTVYAMDGPNSPTYVNVNIDLLSINDGSTLCGTFDLEIEQRTLSFHGKTWKRVLTVGSEYGQVISYGRNNFYKIPSLIESLAVRASNDLSNAGILPPLKK